MKFKILSIVLAATLFVSIAVASVQARPFGSGKGHGGDGRHEMSFAPVHLLCMLNLTDAQEREVATILSKYRGKIEEVATARAEAGKNLMDVTGADDFSETVIRQAAQKLAAQDVEAAVLRAQIMNEVKSVLNAEQKERLSCFRERRDHWMKPRPDKRLSDLDDWIAAHSK